MKSNHGTLLFGMNVFLYAIFMVVNCYGADNDVKEDDSKKFDVIEFGGHNWLVLEIKDGKALILSEKELGTGRYHSQSVAVAWESSAIRKYLNTEFLQSFSPTDRNRIADTKVVTNNNPWYDTHGGNATTDKIFLLSLEEVVQYFGDSGKLKNGSGQEHYFTDQYSQLRIAYDKNGMDSWWWLRSPGSRAIFAAYVHGDSDVYVCGFRVHDYGGGVRPALWLKLQ